MYAIVQLGGRQWRVEPGTTLLINRLPLEVGAQHTVDQVLFARDGEQVSVGVPFVAGASVVCEVLEHRLGPKEISFHYRRRENWRRKHGHRQPLTKLEVKEISVGGKKVSSVEKAKKAPAAPKAKSAAPAKAKADAAPKTGVVKTAKKEKSEKKTAPRARKTKS